MSKRLIQWAAILCSMLAAVSVQAVEVRSQVRLVNSSSIYIGQQVTLEIELQVDGWFAGATEQPLFTLDDALVVRQPSSATNGSRRIEGRNWATQVWQRTFFPQRAGEWRFPSQQFSLRVGGESKDGIRVVERAVSSAPMTFDVLPLPAKNSPQKNSVLPPAAAKLQLQSRWNRLPSESLQAGTVVRQRLELSAEQVSNGLLPNLAEQAQKRVQDPAVTLFTSELERIDEWRGGDLLSRIVWQLDYLLTESGSYPLPELSVDYWQPQQQRWLQVVAPGKTFTVGAKGAPPTMADKQTINFWLLFVVSAVLVLFAAFAWRRRNSRIDSQLRRALVLGGESAVAYRALTAYLAERQIVATPTQWASAANPELAELVAALNRSVVQTAPIDKGLVWAHWRKPLKRQQAEQRRLGERSKVSLPPLNNDTSAPNRNGRL
ncbi:MAG: hypothetical protein ACN4EJ_02105 [Porticoccaceae bacterium]